MQPYKIVIRRVTVFSGQLAEIPPDAPASLRTWSCNAFFVPGGKASELKAGIKQTHIDITEVEGGCGVYGGHHWREKTKQDLGVE
jgi:hypothetical protein